jgi:predicted O-linked N-acetylglucosamine transferase (SPINDLY family)
LHPDYDAAAIAREHRIWNDKFIRPNLGKIGPYDNERSPDRRLKIGYVSADFRNHPVGRFLLPLFANHDHQKFEIFCYSNVNPTDEFTDRLRPCADHWRNIRLLNDDAVAEQIRQDRIDILIDLALHTDGTKIMVFARKPAPVQANYLAYCSTSGLETMDYRLSDPYLDPVGGPEDCYVEKTIRLAHSYWCYEVHVNTPETNPPPMLQTGYVTFGCLNNYSKNSKKTWEAWHQLLKAVPKSRLVVYALKGSHRELAKERTAAAGIDAERLVFVGNAKTEEYFQQYLGIDIALDPFPYGGGTTTCDALWMGVPVVTLRGQTAVGRGGVSILSNIGLPELIADSPREYVQIAAQLAGDRKRLSELRGTLRQRMKDSPLTDGPQFAREVEAAYRQMWEQWCEKQSELRSENVTSFPPPGAGGRG